jgi:hypothetical protein
MSTHKISLSLDEALVRRARDQDVGRSDKSDAQIIEDRRCTRH